MIKNEASFLCASNESTHRNPGNRSDVETCASKLKQVGDGIRTLIDYLLQLRNEYRSSSQCSVVEEEVDIFVKFLGHIAVNQLPILKQNRYAMTSITAGELGLEPLIEKLKEAALHEKTAEGDEWTSSMSPETMKRVLKTFRRELRSLFSLTFNRTMILREQCNEWDFQTRLVESVQGKEVEEERRQQIDEFHDPVTGELMCDPVKGSDGFTYDRWTFIDDKWTRSHHVDRTRETPLIIACDDVNVRSRLFEKYPTSGLQEMFRNRRRRYREQAIVLAKHGSSYRDVEVLKRLDHVLQWDFDDAECRQLRDARADRLQLPKPQSVATVYPRDPWTEVDEISRRRPSRRVPRCCQLLWGSLASAGSLLLRSLCLPVSACCALFQECTALWAR